MQKTVDELTTCLERMHRVVYIADDFYWKELALKKLKGCSDIEITEDPKALELYRMYEFSDRFIVLEESDNYGNIWNYVRSGLITAEEALECLTTSGDGSCWRIPNH